MKQLLLVVGLLLSATIFNAHAVLTPYNSNGVDLVYSSVSDITWTKDANLFKTMYDANYNLISQIAAVTPSYNDPGFGVRTIDSSDFNTSNGRMTWWGGLAFTNYLNTINYGGSSIWRLPTTNTIGVYNPADNELGELYYSELGALAYPGSNGKDFGILKDGVLNNGSLEISGSAGPFINVQVFVYWLGMDMQWDDEYIDQYFDGAWVFETDKGEVAHFTKLFDLYVWPVSPGIVPIPAAVWLFGTGLLGLLGLKRRRHVG